MPSAPFSDDPAQNTVGGEQRCLIVSSVSVGPTVERGQSKREVPLPYV